LKKGLIIWNIVITVVALVLLLGACTDTSLQNRVAFLEQMVQAQQNDINNLKSTNTQLAAYIQDNINKTAGLENMIINQIIPRLPQ
jgi:outer membrane biogenesis lipoprotein LolB